MALMVSGSHCGLYYHTILLCPCMCAILDSSSLLSQIAKLFILPDKQSLISLDAVRKFCQAPSFVTAGRYLLRINDPFNSCAHSLGSRAWFVRFSSTTSKSKSYLLLRVLHSSLLPTGREGWGSKKTFEKVSPISKVPLVELRCIYKRALCGRTVLCSPQNCGTMVEHLHRLSHKQAWSIGTLNIITLGFCYLATAIVTRKQVVQYPRWRLTLGNRTKCSLSMSAVAPVVVQGRAQSLGRCLSNWVLNLPPSEIQPFHLTQ